MAKYQAVGTHFNHIAFSGSPSYETLNTTAAADRASLGILTDTYNATLQGMETQSFGQIFGGMYGKGEASERLSAMNGKIIKAVEPAVTKANGRADIDVDAFKQRMMQFRAEKDVEARPEGKEAIQSVNKQQITLKAAEEDVKAHPERQGAMEAIQSANAGWDKKKAESAKGEEAQKEKPKSKSLFSSIGRLFRKIGEVVGLVKPKEISVPYDAAHDVSAGDKLRDMDKLRDQGKKLQPLCGQLQEIEEIRNLNEILKQSGLPKIADDQKLKDISTALRNNIKKEAHYDRSTNYKQMDEESQVKKLEARQDKGASQQMGG